MKIIRWALALVSVLIVLGVVWEFRPYPTIERTKIYAPLLALREPLLIRTYYYSDGGTVGIAIKDAEQTELKFSFPSEYRHESRYMKLFVGALYKPPVLLSERKELKQSPPMTEISPMEPTAEYLRQLLRSRVDDPNVALALSCLSDRRRDRLRVITNKVLHGKTPKVYLY